MAVHVIDEANRCLNCKKPMCREGCPINTPIPQMIQAFKKGNLNEAGEMLFTNNPMSLKMCIRDRCRLPPLRLPHPAL